MSFQLNEMVLALYPRESLAEDAAVSEKGRVLLRDAGAQHKEREGSRCHLQGPEGMGASITKRPRKAEWGSYSGHLVDPDGYLREVVYNPQWKVDSKTRVTLP